MKLPEKCPSCGGNFMLDFYGPEDKYITLSCLLKADHRIVFQAIANETTALRLTITINMEKQIKVNFNFSLKDIQVGKGPNPKFIANATQSLPWFDPDLSDYAKLIDKLKTYVIFT